MTKENLLRLVLLAAFLVLLQPSQARAQALVENGDFSLPFGGGLLAWTPNAVAGPTSVTHTGSAANFSAFSGVGGGVASLSQTGITPLDTTHFWDVEFTISAFTVNIPGADLFEVSYSGVTIFTGAASNSTFNTGLFAITNGTGPLTFTFTSGGFHTLVLDDVILTDMGTPEIDPSSAAAPVALLAGGLLLAFDPRRRVNTSSPQV